MRQNNSTVCSICGKILSTTHGLSMHMETVHRPSDQPKIQCKQCGTW